MLRVSRSIKIGGIRLQKNEFDDQDADKLSGEEEYLVTRINRVHILCGRREFDFRKNYKQALNHIRNKPSDDWYECAAKDAVLFKEYVDFFSVFEEINDVEKRKLFEATKENIKYLYYIIQEIKHCNRGNVEKEFLCPYGDRFGKEITNDQYERIFKDLQKQLINMFKEFKLKDE